MKTYSLTIICDFLALNGIVYLCNSSDLGIAHSAILIIANEQYHLMTHTDYIMEYFCRLELPSGVNVLFHTPKGFFLYLKNLVKRPCVWAGKHQRLASLSAYV